MFDMVIAGGDVVDGSGRPAYRADVGIVRDKVQAIGDLSRAETRRTIDAAGMCVAPGFIDIHGHVGHGNITLQVKQAQGWNGDGNKN